MIQYLEHNCIDKNRWDICIEKAHNGNIYAFSWYLDVVCGHWDALVNEDYSMVFPLPKRKKLNITYLFQPYFIQQLGLFSEMPLTEPIMHAFIEAIPREYKYGELNLNHFNPIRSLPYLLTEQVNLELSLQDTYEKNFNQFTDNHRRNIRKSSVSGLNIVKDSDIQGVIDMFQKGKGMELNRLGEDFYKMLTKVYKVLMQRDRAGLWMAESNGEACAGVLFAFSHQKAVFLFSASSEKGKKMSAMHFIVDAFIKEYSGKIKVLDFEGSNNSGLARFYSGFGAEHRNYYQMKINRLNKAENILYHVVRKKK